ncbi:MAG: plasmid stabilization system [Caulobacteraceae bacterium]|nr:plasmid stabilization system [Caulobacteraceae bacterium]
MNSFRIEQGAERRLEEIYRYTCDTWGEARAATYIKGMFQRFEAIARRQFPWRRIPTEFGLDGYFCRYEKHFIYWELLADGSVGILAILHERMHQLAQFRDQAP